MIVRFIFLCSLILGFALPLARAELQVSLLGPRSAIAPGTAAEFELVLLNPANHAQVVAIPTTLEVSLLDATGRSWTVVAPVTGSPWSRLEPGTFTQCTLRVDVPAAAQGQLVVEITAPSWARSVVTLAGGVAAQPQERTLDSPGSAPPTPDAVPADGVPPVRNAQFFDHFGIHEPIYFLYGRETPAAKFQFSFKYRLFGLSEDLVESLPALRGIHFGYTQRSLWDIGGESSPFYDTSYMPELFYESAFYGDQQTGFIHWLGFQLGVRHESNGQNDLDSRSLNFAYLRPTLAFGDLEGWRVMLSPLFFSYITDMPDNPDMRDYRGYMDVRLSVGRARSWELAVTARLGKDLKNAGLQTDLTVPLQAERLGFSAYLMLQYYNGYSESLLRYRERTSTWRAGLSFAR